MLLISEVILSSNPVLWLEDCRESGHFSIFMCNHWHNFQLVDGGQYLAEVEALYICLGTSDIEQQMKNSSFSWESFPSHHIQNILYLLIMKKTIRSEKTLFGVNMFGSFLFCRGFMFYLCYLYLFIHTGNQHDFHCRWCSRHLTVTWRCHLYKRNFHSICVHPKILVLFTLPHL